MDQQDTQEELDLMVPRDIPVLREEQGKQDQQEAQVLQEVRVHRDQPDRLV